MVPRGERILAHALILLIALPSVWCIWTRSEIWPWSHYPMYSRVNPPSYRQVTLRGVTEDGAEVDLTQGVYWRPFHVNRVRAVFDRLRQQNARALRMAPPAARESVRDAGERRIASAAHYFARRYEQRRRSRDHDGPPILGIRFYASRWQLESWAANRDTPFETKLIAEIEFPRPEASGDAGS